MSIPHTMLERIQAIHQSEIRIMLVLAGAGTEALHWLHCVAGSSRTVLEARDCYSTTSFDDFISTTPSRYVSENSALALARAAYQRAQTLHDGTVIGVGSTATIATHRQKKGAHHQHVAVTTALGTKHYHLVLAKGRTRAEEERLVSHAIIHAIAEGCGLYAPPLPLSPEDSLEHHFYPIPALETLSAKDYIYLNPQARRSAMPRERYAILAGSFNPLHQGHIALAETVHKHTGRKVIFELSIDNVDKPSLSPAVVQWRAQQCSAQGRALIIDRAALFKHKATLFPHSLFVVGFDTAARILSPRFYRDDAAMLETLEHIRQHGCTFLVAGRLQGDTFLQLEHLDIPANLQGLFQGLFQGLADFRSDISSTELRAQQQSALL